MKRNLLGDPMINGEVLGCTRCPMNKVPGVRKVKGLERIRGRRIFVWAQSPGRQENQQGMELVGPSGKLLWDALQYHGIKRSDCDIQNGGMRCYPIDKDGTEHEPTREELKCCSVFNEEARDRNQGKAVVHLILGTVAGTALLGSALRKDKPVSWYAPWNAYVVWNQHPSWLLHMGGRESGRFYTDWRDRMHTINAILDHPGQYGYVKAQDYRTVRGEKSFDEMEAHIRSDAAAGRRVSVDIEDGTVDGKPVVLLIGFGTGMYRKPGDWRSWKGRSYTVVLDHPEANHAPGVRDVLYRRLKALLEDKTILKTLQNGSYDSVRLRSLLKISLRGYDYDTMYGTYIRYSFLRQLGLDDQVYQFLPEFGDYKEMVAEYSGNYANVPLEILALYNNCDCDATKRLEAMHAPHISYPLVQVYIHAGFTLHEMETRGPILDRENMEKVRAVIPKQIEEYDMRIRHVAEDPDMNPESNPQIAWLLYDKLQLGSPEEEGYDSGERGRKRPARSTERDILEKLAADSGSPVPIWVSRRRALSKILGTYIDGWVRSADMHDGELRTWWMLTGAITGRLRSGGDGKPGYVNLQNLINDPLLLNMLVSTPHWRKALEVKCE